MSIGTIITLVSVVVTFASWKQANSRYKFYDESGAAFDPADKLIGPIAFCAIWCVVVIVATGFVLFGIRVRRASYLIPFMVVLVIWMVLLVIGIVMFFVGL